MAMHSIKSFLENSQGLKSLVGYSPWGCKQSDMAEQQSKQHSAFLGGWGLE